MVLGIDNERLVMTGVLIAALILWGGIAIDYLEVYPAGMATAATVLGVFITVFMIVVLAVHILTNGLRGNSNT